MRVLLCAPTYFDVPETDIDNKHMDPKNRPNFLLAKAQHDALIQTYENLGLEVWLIPPRKGLVDMTFTANCGFAVGKKFVLSNYKPLRRREEAGHFKEFFESLGYQVFILPEGVFFEGGGDAVLYKDKILCGYGFRTSKDALPYLERFLEKEVVLLELIKPSRGDKNFYHFDTTIIVLEDIESFISYRGAFSRESWNRLESLGEVLPASYQDAANLALNAVVAPKRELNDSLRKLDIRGSVVTSALASQPLIRTLQAMKYQPVLVNLSEFLKSGGGAFCLTKVF